MTAQIGQLSLALAFGLALIQAIVPLAGAQAGNTAWMRVARPAAQAQAFMVAVAFIALAWAFLRDDFSLLYVANNSNTAMPEIYKFSAVWGAHEGSLLLWVLILALWSVAVSVFSRSLPLVYVARVLGVMGLVNLGFLAFMLFTSNPFVEVFPAPAEGRQLNPLLQDPGLAIHPPMLYAGYVGFSVAFAFAIAALLGGRLDATWARWSRPWTTAAWVFLTVGITLGSWWAYYELGWGGWWFWDPVENASFMPWLVGTALIHSLAVTEKRGTFKAWTVLLAIFAFSLSLLGTFLVRSGVLTSVHAFATDPERGLFILMFLGVVIGGSLALYAWRGGKVRSAAGFELLSRESLMLANNVILVVVAAAVLLGTLYPLALDAFAGQKISVGPPFFNLVFMILMTPLVVLIGLGPLLRWKRHAPGRLWRQARGPALVTVAAFVLAAALLASDSGTGRLMLALGVGLALWVVLSLAVSLRERLGRKGFSPRALAGLGFGYWGMWLAHLGVAVFILGVTFVSAYSIEDDVRMAPGDSVTLAGYTFRFDGVNRLRKHNYTSTRGTVTVFRDGRPLEVMHPEKRDYGQGTMPMTEAAIDGGLFRDLYVSLGEPLEGDVNGPWLLRVYYKPFQRWIWLAGVLMAVGGILAAADPRYRRVLARDSRRESAAAEALLEELLGEAPAKGSR